MTEDEFCRRYDEYETTDRAEAEREAASITLEHGSHPVVVGLPFDRGVVYCLMLPQVVSYLREENILPPQDG